MAFIVIITGQAAIVNPHQPLLSCLLHPAGCQKKTKTKRCDAAKWLERLNFLHSWWSSSPCVNGTFLTALDQMYLDIMRRSENWGPIKDSWVDSVALYVVQQWTRLSAHPEESCANPVLRQHQHTYINIYIQHVKIPLLKTASCHCWFYSLHVLWIIIREYTEGDFSTSHFFRSKSVVTAAAQVAVLFPLH